MSNNEEIAEEEKEKDEVKELDWVNQFVTLDFTDPKSPHDRILVVEGQKFYVYSGLLSSWSEYFRTMFNGEFKEKNQEEIELHEVEAEHFHSFLKAMNPAILDAINKDNYLVITSYAHRFLSREVFQLCENFIEENFGVLNNIDLLKAAFEYDWTKLKDRLALFIAPVASPTIVQMTCHGCEAVENNRCTTCRISYKDISGFPLLSSQFVVTNEEAIAQLQPEIQAFILQTLLKRAAQ